MHFPPATHRQPKAHSLSVFCRAWLSLLLVCGLLFATPSSAQAWTIPGFEMPRLNVPIKGHRLSFDINLSSVYEYHTYNPAIQRSAHSFQYMDLQNRLDLKITYDNISVGGRVDTFNFFQDRAPCPDKSPNCKAAYLPEKLFLRGRFGNFDFTAGDFYLTVGRGLALAIRKVDAFGLDTTLRGARATYQDKGFRATIAGGFTNANNFEPVQEIILDDPNDFMFAADIEQRFLKLFSLGVHYVHARIEERQVLFDGRERVSTRSNSHITGGRISFPRVLNKMDFYFEGNVQFETNNELPRDPGYALYFNFNGYFFPVTIQFEAQWYSRYRLQTNFTQRYSTVPSPPLLYLNQPSMERPDLDTQGDNANSKGARLRIDYTLPDRKTVFHINYLFRYGFTDVAEAEQLMIHHAYAGVEHHGGVVHLNLSGGFRQILGFEYWRLIHGDIDLSIRMAPKHAIDIVSRYWYSNRGGKVVDTIPFEDQVATFHIVDAQIGYTFAGFGSIAFLFSFTDENSNADIRQFYYAGELKINILENGFLKFFYGNVRGGLRCVSGVCRIFPAFEGFRTELLFRL